ncbi:PREDICTED: achelase-1-like [Ceratosolen solmsi marchali]|uniref:Achelase-1-like n=1 Tax=Ceratosolen solmsi marchali TaxID=326594 RepID=A0AAJ6YM64_9HYME|nr:PREDICTED: achelase-1-like [Ceratosolen solmsi marchali]
MLFIIVHDKIVNVKALVGSSVRDALPDEFPFIAAIVNDIPNFEYDKDLICTGVLANRQSVITTAHCLEQDFEYNIKLIIGSNDLLSLSQYHIAFWLSYNQWAQYSRIHVTFSTNDICVLRLTSHVHRTIQPAVIAYETYNQFNGQNIVLAGWGQINNTTFPRILQTSPATVLSNENCLARVNQLVSGQFIVDGNIFCSAGNPFTYVMLGDNGGPVVYRNRVIGINMGTCPHYENHQLHANKVNIHINLYVYQHFLRIALQ